MRSIAILPTITANWPENDSLRVFLLIGVCQSLDAPQNGEILDTNFEYGSTARFRCKDGYILLGNQSITCVNGTWDNKPPICRGKICRLIEEVVYYNYKFPHISILWDLHSIGLQRPTANIYKTLLNLHWSFAFFLGRLLTRALESHYP